MPESEELDDEEEDGEPLIGPVQRVPVTRIVITPPRLEAMLLHLRGVAPYMQARFTEKAQAQMAEQMMAGSTAKKGRQRKPRDFEADFRDAAHVSDDGWYGVPAAAFRAAAIDACRMTGYQMTRAKMSIFVMADGLDRNEQTPLVRLLAGEPERNQMAVRNSTGVADIRVRPLWRTWEIDVKVTYDADQFTASDVVNLFDRAGKQVGIGEGRPFSKKSYGLGFGLFHIVEP